MACHGLPCLAMPNVSRMYRLLGFCSSCICYFVVIVFLYSYHSFNRS
jgi:hypothetical protein